MGRLGPESRGWHGPGPGPGPLALARWKIFWGPRLLGGWVQVGAGLPRLQAKGGLCAVAALADRNCSLSGRWLEAVQNGVSPRLTPESAAPLSRPPPILGHLRPSIFPHFHGRGHWHCMCTGPSGPTCSKRQASACSIPLRLGVSFSSKFKFKCASPRFSIGICSEPT